MHLHPTLCSGVLRTEQLSSEEGKGRKAEVEGGGGRCVEKEERRGERRKKVGGSERQSRRRWKECRDTLWCERSVLLQYDSDRLM